MLKALSKLGYYHGEISGEWSPDAENALNAFGVANQFFPRVTVLEGEDRFIDEPTALFIILGEKRKVLVPNSP